MRGIAWSLVAGVALAGCAQPPLSAGPFYAAEQLVWDPEVLGEWSEADSLPPSLTVERTGYYRYRVTTHEEDRSDTYTGRVFAFARWRAVDLTAVEDAENRPLVMPLHMFLRYAVRGDTLWVGYGDDSTWAARIPAHRQVGSPDGSFVLLSAPPESLQAVAVAMLEDTTTQWHFGYYVRPAPAAPGVPVARAP
jgi:hypothetical protein